MFQVHTQINLITELKIQSDIKEVFNLLKTARPEKTEFNNDFNRTKGNCEYIYFRFKFKDEKHRKYNELTIFLLIKEQKGITENFRNYIVIEHSDINRYYIKSLDNKDLWFKLKEFVDKDYGGNLELYP